MVNLMFGAYCPELQKMLTDELQIVQNGGEHQLVLSQKLLQNIYSCIKKKITRITISTSLPYQFYLCKVRSPII